MSHDADLVAKVAEAIFDVVVDHPMWLGDDGEPLDYNPDREARICDFAGDAARAVLDALGLPARDRRAKAAALRDAADARPEWQATLNAEDDQHFIAGSAHGAGPDVACDVFEAWLTDRAAEIDPEEGDHE